MKRVKVGLVGITGYTGMELLRLLSLHPQLIVTRVTSRSEADKKVADIHPFLLNTPLGDLVISKPDTKDLAGACELVFLAVPHGTAMVMAAEARSSLFITFSLLDHIRYGSGLPCRTR